MSLHLRRLRKEDRRLLKRFENDELDLVTYLRRWALVHQERDYLGRTWLAIDEEEKKQRIAGYFTLSAASLERKLVEVGELGRLPGFPIPAVLLARLAVDRRVQGQGIGRWLFDEALLKTLRLAADGPIGFRVLLTDAKNERAAGFYESRGMIRLGGEEWPVRMALDLKPLIPV